MTTTSAALLCSFCARSSKQVKKLIAGPQVFICDECVGLCQDALRDVQPRTAEKPQEAATDLEKAPRPRAVKAFLDRYVVGQDRAKTVLSVAVYDHYKRLNNPVVDGVEIEKANVLLIGPTGSGKTLIAQTIARMLDVPFAVADATSLTEAGYVGDDVEMVIGSLLQAAGGDVKKAERGIIFIDEIDKRVGKNSANNTRDVSGEGAQQAMLKILEGSDVMAPANGKKGPGADLVKVNTKNILFVLGGAFVGLDRVIGDGLEQGSGIGFGAEAVGRRKRSLSETMSHLSTQHLVKFGLIPELVGRIPVHVVLDEIDEPSLVRVLTEPENSLVKQYKALFGLDGVKLSFEPDALTLIARDALKRGTGARGLRGVLAACLMPIQFNLPDLRDNGATSVVVRADQTTAVPSILYGDTAATPQ